MIFNPNKQPEGELPVIYGFASGNFGPNLTGEVVAEDGTFLGSDISSNEHWLQLDLGVVGDMRPDRLETFREHYPDGYRTLFVPLNDEGLTKALKLAAALPAREPAQDWRNKRGSLLARA